MRRPRRRGAILMDVLVAVYILSVGLFSLAGVFIQISRAGQQVNCQEIAVLLAQEKLELLHGQGSVDWQAATLLGMAGVEIVERGGLRFERSTRIGLRSDLDSTGHLLEAEVRVAWTENGRNGLLVLLTYFAVGTALEKL